ncbi:MAG: adenosylcobinamide-phosphate synthase CbiB [Nitrospirales bacterium]
MDSLEGFKLLAVCALDVLVGDPRWLPHPVRLMGKGIQVYEQVVLRWCKNSLATRVAGVVLALGLPFVCFWVVQEIIEWATHVNKVFGVVMWISLGFTTIAARDLWDHGFRVYQALEEESLSSARLAVGQLVGRDTTDLSEAEVIRATIESVSESTSDGIVAPLCCLALGGPALALAYKAINTLDSMIGYRHTRYRDFGWASARLDDVVNWIPARLTAVLLAVAAAVRLRRGREAWRICWRDARNHPSPNSGWPEAAMAGALGVQLGGVNVYEGVAEQRAPLGDQGNPFSISQILLALQLMGLASGFLVIILGGWVMM